MSDSGVDELVALDGKKRKRDDHVHQEVNLPISDDAIADFSLLLIDYARRTHFEDSATYDVELVKLMHIQPITCAHRVLFGREISNRALVKIIGWGLVCEAPHMGSS